MFTRRNIRGVMAFVCFAAALTVAQSGSQSSREETLPPGAAKDAAESACLGCHEARIIVQQRLNKAAWTKEVDKMTKWGAPVEAKDRDALIDYLSTNFNPERAPYDAPRSSGRASEKK